MDIYTIDAEPLKAAMLHQAKADVRYYLNGIYLDKEHGRVVGTNGHTAAIIKDGAISDLPQSMIVVIGGTVPARADKAHITVLDERHGYIYYTGPRGPIHTNGQLVRHFYDVIEGNFPDIDKAIGSKFEASATDRIAVNGNYMGNASKTVRALRSNDDAVRCWLAGDNGVIKIKGGRGCSHEHEIYVMPCRFD